VSCQAVRFGDGSGGLRDGDDGDAGGGVGRGAGGRAAGARDAAAVEREASEFAAGWSWLDELGEVMRMLWDASRGIIVPGDDATGGSSSTALEPANEEGLSGEV
jgi:hypothetical protein